VLRLSRGSHGTPSVGRHRSENGLPSFPGLMRFGQVLPFALSDEARTANGTTTRLLALHHGDSKGLSKARLYRPCDRRLQRSGEPLVYLLTVRRLTLPRMAVWSSVFAAMTHDETGHRTLCLEEPGYAKTQTRRLVMSWRMADCGSPAPVQNPKSAEQVLAESQAAVLERQDARAIRTLKGGLRSFPDNNDMRVLLNHQDASAIALFREALRLEVQNRGNLISPWKAGMPLSIGRWGLAGLNACRARQNISNGSAARPRGSRGDSSWARRAN